MRVLGISIGTRRNGLAVFDGTDLTTAEMHSVCERWSSHKIAALLAIYKRFIHRHRISSIVVKIPKASHFSQSLKQLIRALDAYVKKQGCLIEYTTIEHIKKGEPSIKNRNQLREFAVATYPQLLRIKRKDIGNKQPYYMKLFEATVVAHIHIMRELRK